METKICVRQRDSSLFSGSDSPTKPTQVIYLIDGGYLPPGPSARLLITRNPANPLSQLTMVSAVGRSAAGLPLLPSLFLLSSISYKSQRKLYMGSLGKEKIKLLCEQEGSSLCLGIS